eukprot:Colp12_sorted_trinity150504_noHs@21451
MRRTLGKRPAPQFTPRSGRWANKRYILGLVVFIVLVVLGTHATGLPSRAVPTPKFKKVLVTGAAGFVGYHLMELLHANNNEVVGLDNFNDYYDVQLKKDRVVKLLEKGLKVVDADVCDVAVLEKLFQEHQFTHVAHLAAQAGVRYSLINPQAYIRSNLECFVELLEVVRKINPQIKFIYASSSSVYGQNTKIPFDVTDRVDSPASLYGATKKANEVIAYAYHNIYKIPVTGLRFFTVYGRYGRPDMAVYEFTDKIIKGEPINVYEKGSLERDFTHVSDIVKGVEAILDLGADLEVFNLGKGHPEKVNDLIDEIEKAVGKEAIKDFKPFQKGDVVRTFADISHTQTMLGFAPNTPLHDGITDYVKWHKEYMEYRTSSDPAVVAQREQAEQLYKTKITKYTDLERKRRSVEDEHMGAHLFE